MPKFNTMLDVAFTVEHDCEDESDIPHELLIAALQRRINDLKANPREAVVGEAFGVSDTYAIAAGEHCPDESCPGVIDEDGECSHCGEDYAELNKLPKDEYFV